jgi:hypothetical protein
VYSRTWFTEWDYFFDNCGIWLTENRPRADDPSDLINTRRPAFSGLSGPETIDSCHQVTWIIHSDGFLIIFVNNRIFIADALKITFPYLLLWGFTYSVYIQSRYSSSGLFFVSAILRRVLDLAIEYLVMRLNSSVYFLFSVLAAILRGSRLGNKRFSDALAIRFCVTFFLEISGIHHEINNWM